jgi:hypothetical protein
MTRKFSDYKPLVFNHLAITGSAPTVAKWSCLLSDDLFTERLTTWERPNPGRLQVESQLAPGRLYSCTITFSGFAGQSKHHKVADQRIIRRPTSAALVKGATATRPRMGPPVASSTRLAEEIDRALAVHFLQQALRLALPLPRHRSSDREDDNREERDKHENDKPIGHRDQATPASRPPKARNVSSWPEVRVRPFVSAHPQLT